MSDQAPSTDLVIAAPQRLQRSFTLLPETFGEAREMAAMIAASEFAPKDYKGKPESVLIAIQMGADVGLRPMQALQNIAVINGRPCIWGDGALALTMSLFEKFEEKFEGEWPAAKDVATSDFTAVCTIRRRGWPTDTVQRFSIADAVKAGLWGKTGPWTNYPKRMLQMRCRSWALRDAAADRLMGLILAEEAMDYDDEPRHIGSGSTVPDAEAPELVAFAKLPEPVRDRIEKGFEVCNLTNGLRRAKLKEYLLAADTDVEEQGGKLLEWLENEYAKRKTGKPVARKKGDGNGKPVAESVKASETKGARDDEAEGGVGGEVPASVLGPTPTSGTERGGKSPLGSPTLAANASAAVKASDDSLF